VTHPSSKRFLAPGTGCELSIIALAAIGVVAIVVGYVVAGRALAPLQRVTATARRLSESTLHQRIALEGPEDEIKELADTFDAMLERLARAFDSQRRFVANASHELRTPLTINRTLLEVALADPQASEDLKVLGRTLLATNARHQRLIDGLLLLARSERGLDARTSVDLSDVAHSALSTVRPALAAAGLTLDEELAPAPTAGEPVLLEHLVHNLLDNAVKYNCDGGTVWLRTWSHDGGSFVYVANTGPTVAWPRTGSGRTAARASACRSRHRWCARTPGRSARCRGPVGALRSRCA
jgi:signal transduction histidine kinase